MQEIDPGLAIVITVGVTVVGWLLWSWRQRRAIRARIAALRDAGRIEVEILSQGRMSAVMAATILPIVFAVPFVAMALGEWGRAHALAFVITLLVAMSAAVMLASSLAPRWARVGQLVLEGDLLAIESPEARAAIALDGQWELREAFVPPGRDIETIVSVTRGETQILFRYPNFVSDELLAPEGAVAARAGVLLGAEARAIHERLRVRQARARAERMHAK